MTIAREMYEKFVANPEQDTLVHLPYFRELARKAQNVLEIGVEWGASSSAWLSGFEDANSSGHLWSVDIKQRSGIEFLDHPNWTYFVEDSKDIEKIISQIPYDGQFIDVLFIDGDHSLEGCYADLKNYARLVTSGGLILVHDVRPEDGESFPGVRMAFETFQKETGWVSEIREGSCGLGVIRKP